MLCFSPIATRPICALPVVTLGAVEVTAQTIVEARLRNPLADLVQNPSAQIVIALEITTVPLDPF